MDASTSTMNIRAPKMQKKKISLTNLFSFAKQKHGLSNKIWALHHMARETAVTQKVDAVALKAQKWAQVFKRVSTRVLNNVFLIKDLKKSQCLLILIQWVLNIFGHITVKINFSVWWNQWSLQSLDSFSVFKIIFFFARSYCVFRDNCRSRRQVELPYFNIMFSIII